MSNATATEILEAELGIQRITRFQEFENALLMDRAIIFMEAKWSGSAVISWSALLASLKAIGTMDIPVYSFAFSINDHRKEMEAWMKKINLAYPKISIHGWGETLLVERGRMIGFMRCPVEIEWHRRIAILRSWIYFEFNNDQEPQYH